jgi:hypothetical protein
MGASGASQNWPSRDVCPVCTTHEGSFPSPGPRSAKGGGESKDAPQTALAQEHIINNTVEKELTERPLIGTPLPVYPEEELMEEMKHQYQQDPFFKQILDSPKAFKNFIINEGIIRIKLNDMTVICVPNIKVQDRCLQEMVINQAH